MIETMALCPLWILGSEVLFDRYPKVHNFSPGVVIFMGTMSAEPGKLIVAVRSLTAANPYCSIYDMSLGDNP